jgi:hypothetical protein
MHGSRIYGQTLWLCLCAWSGGGITNITLATHDAINQEQHARNPQMYELLYLFSLSCYRNGLTEP